MNNNNIIINSKLIERSTLANSQAQSALQYEHKTHRTKTALDVTTDKTQYEMTVMVHDKNQS